MILFDTNQLLRVAVTSPTFAMVRAVAEEAGQELAVSQVTVDEFHARHERDVRNAVAQVCDATRAVSRVVPDWKSASQEYPDETVVADARTRLVTDVFTVLSVEAAHGREAMRREARRRLPASVDEKKASGARDAAIWLAAVDASKARDETVYLVSDDKRAFGQDQLHLLLVAEATSVGAEVVLCTDVAQLMAQFAKPAATRLEPEVVEQLLADPKVVTAVVEATSMTTFLASASAIGSEAVFSSGNVVEPLLVVHDDVHEYEVEGVRWIAAHTRWKFSRVMTEHAFGRSEAPSWSVELSQDLTLVLRVTEGGEVDSAQCLGWDPPLVLGTARVEL